MSRILRFSFLMLLLAAFHLGAYAQEQTEAKTAKVKLTKSEKKELNDSIRARARQRALEKEVDRQYRKLERQKMKEIPVSEEDVVYLFGVGTNFNDSTVYLTDIIPVVALLARPLPAVVHASDIFAQPMLLQHADVFHARLASANQAHQVRAC